MTAYDDKTVGGSKHSLKHVQSYRKQMHRRPEEFTTKDRDTLKGPFVSEVGIRVLSNGKICEELAKLKGHVVENLLLSSDGEF